MNHCSETSLKTLGDLPGLCLDWFGMTWLLHDSSTWTAAIGWRPARFGMSSLFFQGDLFYNLLQQARTIVFSGLKIDFNPPGAY